MCIRQISVFAIGLTTLAHIGRTPKVQLYMRKDAQREEPIVPAESDYAVELLSPVRPGSETDEVASGGA